MAIPPKYKIIKGKKYTRVISEGIDSNAKTIAKYWRKRGYKCVVIKRERGRGWSPTNDIYIRKVAGGKG